MGKVFGMACNTQHCSGEEGGSLEVHFPHVKHKVSKRFEQDCSLFLLTYGKLDRTSLLQAVLSSSNKTYGTILSGMYHCHTRLMCFLPHVAGSSNKALPHRLHHMLMMLSQCGFELDNLDVCNTYPPFQAKCIC